MPAAPKIAQLNRRVKVYRREDAANDDNSLTLNFAMLKEVWAEVLPSSASAYWGSKQVDESFTHKITMRYLPLIAQAVDIGTAYELECEGWRYRPLRAMDWNGEHRFIVMECVQLRRGA